MIKTGLVWTALLTATALAATLAVWPMVPADAQVPMHWNLAGEPDRYGGKIEGLLTIPAIMAGIAGIFAVLPKIDPRRENLQRSRGAFLTGWIGAELVLLAAHVVLLRGAIGGTVPLSLIMGAVCALFVLLGNAIAKSRSNWFVGVRTPWSLSNEDAWVAANRAAGCGFVATGLLGGAALFLFDHNAAILIFVAGAVASSLTATLISYVVWQRRQPAD